MAWGGDGTINEVASALAFSDVPLGIVPAGSGNGLARELGIDARPGAAIAEARCAREPRADGLGEIDGRLFVNIAGIGFDAHVAARFNEPATGGAASPATRGIAARALATLRAGALSRSTTPATASTSRAVLVTVANSAQFGNGARIAPRRARRRWAGSIWWSSRSARGCAPSAQMPRLFNGTVDADAAAARCGGSREATIECDSADDLSRRRRAGRRRHDAARARPSRRRCDRRVSARRGRRPRFPTAGRPRLRGSPATCRSSSTARVERLSSALASSSTLTTPIAPVVAASEREVGDVDAVAAENRADLADDARLIVVGDDQHRARQRRFDRRRRGPTRAAGCSARTPCLRPSARRASVCSLIETRLVKCARARAARLDDLDAALARRRRARSRSTRRSTRIGRSDAGGRARREHVDAAALGQRAVVADAERLDARRAHLRRRARRADRPAGSTAAAAAARPAWIDGKFTALRTTPSRRKSRTVAAVSRPTSSCASSVDAAMCGVATTCGSWASDQSAGGSFSNTSSAGAGDDAASRSRGASARFVDQLAARGVDDADARLAAREALVVEQVLAFRASTAGAASGSRPSRTPRRATAARRRAPAAISGEMNGSCATMRMPNARARCATSWPMRPRPATPSVLPRSSVPRNRFFSHVPSFIARSAAGTEPRQREHQRAGVLGDADAVGARRVDDEDAAGAGRRDVDVVDAGAGAGDDAQPRRGVEQRAVDLRRAADDQRVGVGQVVRECGRRPAGPRVDSPAGLGAQQLQRGAGRVVGDDDFHSAWSKVDRRMSSESAASVVGCGYSIIRRFWSSRNRAALRSPCRGANR